MLLSSIQQRLAWLLAAVGVVLIGAYLLFVYQAGKGTLPGKDISHLGKDAIPGHREALKSNDATSRKKAANSLWQIGLDAKDSTSSLLAIARDPDEVVREAVIKALGRTSQGTQDAVPALIVALEDKSPTVRAAAATSLAEIWENSHNLRQASVQPDLPPLPGSPAQRMGGGRSAPAGGIPFLKLPVEYEELARKAIPLLAQLLRDADERVRIHSSDALAATGPLAESAVPELMNVVKDDTNEAARIQAALACHNIGPGARAAVPVLVEKLRVDKSDGVRVTATRALGMIHADPEIVVPALVETFLKDPLPDARNWAMFSIGQFGAEAQRAVPVLQEAAKDPENQKSESTMRNINRLLSFLERSREEQGKEGPGKSSPPKEGPDK